MLRCIMTIHAQIAIGIAVVSQIVYTRPDVAVHFAVVDLSPRTHIEGDRT